MARKSKSVYEKMQQEHPEFVAVVEGLSVQELENKLSSYAKEADKVEEAKKEDAELNASKLSTKELGAPYRDAKKAIALKMKYLIESIKGKGGDA